MLHMGVHVVLYDVETYDVELDEFYASLSG